MVGESRNTVQPSHSAVAGIRIPTQIRELVSDFHPELLEQGMVLHDDQRRSG